MKFLSISLFLLAKSFETVTCDSVLPEGLSENTKVRRAIINGVTAEEGRYPYFTELVSSVPGGAPGTTSFDVRVSPDKPGVGIERESTFWMLHPDYLEEMVVIPGAGEGNNVFNDILLLLLDEPIPAESVTPVKLNQDICFPTANTVGKAIGLGVTETGEPSDVLLEADIAPLDDDFCRSVADQFGIESDLDVQMCAIGQDQAVCFGDSGGPLLIAGDRPAEDVVVGVSSFGGSRSCLATIPSAFARIPFKNQESILTDFICAYSSVRPKHCPGGKKGGKKEGMNKGKKSKEGKKNNTEESLRSQCKSGKKGAKSKDKLTEKMSKKKGLQKV